MKIEQLIKAVNESVSNEAFNTAVNPNSPLGRAQAAEKAKADAAATTPNLTVMPGGKGTGTQPQTAPVSFGKGVSMPTNPVTVPGAGTSAVPTTQPTVAKTPAPSTTQPVGPTGDPVLDKPLSAAAPKKPGTTLAQKVGGLAKGVGAVAGGVAGIGRAVKKGYAAGANAVGGPGAPAAGTTGVASSGASQSAADNAELDQLRATLQTMDQRLRRAGI